MEPTLTELLNTEFLHCPGCMRGCYKPRMLTCLHSFCDNCVRSAIVKVENSPHAKAVCNGIENHVNENEHSGKHDSACASKVQENRSDGNKEKQDTGLNTRPAQQVDNTVKKYIVCPLCKESTKLPANGGIHGLPLNIFLNSLLQIKGYKMEEGQTCDYCKYDGKETPAGGLCLECQDVLCTECSAAHRRTKLTREHQVVPFTEIAKHRYDHDIRAAQREKCSTHNGQETTWFCEECKVTMCSECKGRQHYQHSYWSFEAALRQYQSKTKMLLGTIDSKLPSIDAWLKFMQTYTEDVKILQEGRVKEIEKHTRDLHRMIEDLKNKHIQRITEVCQQQRKTTLSKMEGLMRAGQYLKHDSQLLTNLLKFGKADEILSMQAPIAERASQLSNQQLGSISSKLTIHFQPKSMGTDCLDKLFGNLSISYLPLTQQESISLGGNSISASIMLPSVLKSAEHVGSFDADCGTDTKDVWPSGVCITQEGDYAIVDRDNSRVKIFDKNGGVKANFGGVGQHELGSPFDVALLKDGNLAVTDYESEDIKIFKPTGEFVRSLRGSFKYPRGIAVNSKGHIVVVDCHFRRVTMHCPETGKLLQTIQGKDENGCDFFTDPYYVAVTPDDKVVVTDWAAPNIRVFSREGRQLNSYGSYGTRQDQILHPYGVCSDQYGYIFVADNQNHRIHLLLPDGNFSRHILTKVDSLWHPIGLVTDNSGNLILTEALGKVKIYKYV